MKEIWYIWATVLRKTANVPFQVRFPNLLLVVYHHQMVDDV